MKHRPAFTMYVVSHTHWDREWYQTFQGYRRRLVYQTDAMLDLLEARPAYPAFHLDGQTSVLDDYMDIRPEQRDRLARLVRAGRVLIGPWYTMPDECHLSGESLVRNLLLGHRRCREWGATPMPIMWVSDVFSHVSQLPQIMAGFGLDCAYMHHGTPCDADERTEMVWDGADGTRVLMLKAHPWYGYQDFLQMRYRTPEKIRAYEDRKIGLATTPVLLGLDGNDHEAAKWDTPEVIDRMNGLFSRTRAVHATLPQYLEALKKALGPHWARGRRRFAGELRVPSKTGNWNGLTNGTGSSRLPLKQAHDQVENLLARLAEPLNAWSASLGGESHRAYLDLAWRYLFLNHPHDSICGCSIDQAHRDMAYRYDQARLLAEDVIEDGLQEVADRLDLTTLAEAPYAVTVFNAGSVSTPPVTLLSFELPSTVVARHAAAGRVPVVSEATGAAIEQAVLRVERGVRARPLTYKDRGRSPAIWVRRENSVDRYWVHARTGLPGLGMRTLRVTFETPRRPVAGKRRSARPAVRVDAARGRLENEHVRIRVRADGRVDLWDRATRTTFGGLHDFEDVGDAGDGWSHRHPDRDRVVWSHDAKARGKVRVSRGHATALSGSLRVSFVLRVPADLVETTPDSGGGRTVKARSTRTVPLRITTELTLMADSRRVDCVTTVDNTARAHRLRVLLPTRRRTDVWYGDTAFDLVQRPIALRDTTGWNEVDREECPIKNVAAVCDARAGLAVLTRGLYEAAVRDRPDRPIALTLFRGFVENLFHEKTQDSLLLGPLTMEYALLPFTPERGGPPAELMSETDRYKLPLHSYTRPATGAPVDPAPLPPCSESNPPQPAPDQGCEVVPLSPELARLIAARPPLHRSLAPTTALLTVSPPLVLSTIKQTETGADMVVRVWNPTARAHAAAMRLGFDCTGVERCDLLEKPLQSLACRGGQVRFRIGPKAIVTLRFKRA